MRIKGKDRDLNDTLYIVKNIIEEAGINVKESNLINPVDGIWSVHLKDHDSPFYTNGKGGSRDSALASAYCEFLERFFSGFFFYDYTFENINKKDKFIASDEVRVNNTDYKAKLLNKSLWGFYCGEDELEFNELIESNLFSNSDEIIALPFYNGNESVLFPLELLKNIYASNGLSAGNSKREALVQGLSECIERGVKNRIIREGLSLPNVSKEILENYGLQQIVEDINSTGYKVLVKDASLGGVFPVICVLLVDRNNGTILSSFGAHPIPQVAIERTLTELLQGRALENMDELTPPISDLDFVRDDSNIESHFINSTGYFHHNILKDIGDGTLWNFDGDKYQELDFLEKCLKESNYKYYTRAVSKNDMWIMQTVVPGLSEIYPTSDLKWNFRNRVNPIINVIRNSNSETIDAALDWLGNSYVESYDKVLPFIGINSTEGSSEHSFTFLELELILLILNGDESGALLLLRNEMDESLICKERLIYWRCLELKLEDKDFDLSLLFSSNIIYAIDELMDGKVLSQVLSFWGGLDNSPKEHKETIGLYKKLKSLII